jgi:hypothetical protein
VESWARHERELRRELAALRTSRSDEPAPEQTGLADGELRDAIAAARESGAPPRPRWADDLLGGPRREDRP